ncbi:zona pellucida sperm-binding protein 3-like [Mustelus asterias]
MEAASGKETLRPELGWNETQCKLEEQQLLFRMDSRQHSGLSSEFNNFTSDSPPSFRLFCCFHLFPGHRFPWIIVKATPRPQTFPPPGPPFDSHFGVSEGQGVSPVQSVRVQCGEDKLLLRVQLDLFGTRHLVKAADLTLGTAGCRPTRIYSQNHTVLFDYGLHECGSRLQMTGDFLIYSTHLSHSPEYHGSVIVRTNGAVVPIECRYFRKGNVSSNPIKPTWIPFSSTRFGEGHLSFSLRLMNGDWLTERTSTVYYLGELIHIEASVSMNNHMALKLYIDRCVGTLRPDKDSSLRHSIIDYNGCLLDSKAEDSFSTFVLPGDEREPDKLHFDLDAFRFFGDEHSLIFITCHLKVVPVDRRDSRNKACTLQKMQNVWTPLEESSFDICACCHVGNGGATRDLGFGSRGRRDLVAEAEHEDCAYVKPDLRQADNSTSPEIGDFKAEPAELRVNNGSRSGKAAALQHRQGDSSK